MRHTGPQHYTTVVHSQTRLYKIVKVTGYALLIFFAFLWLFPFFIMILTSLKSQGDVISRGVFALPKKIVLKNFVRAWHTGQFSVFYRNSLLISLVKVPAGIFVASMAAYPLAKYRFRIRDSLFLFFLAGIGIPIHVTLLPLSLLLKHIGLLDTLAGLFFPYIAFGLPFQIMVCRGFFRGIPTELVDSARLDGCTEFRIYWNIILPLAKPAIAALFIIDFLATWNEFLMALIFIHSDKWKTIPLGLMLFQGQFGTSYPLINAGVLLSILPVLIIYILLQQYFVSGITTGALKG
jgi:raffinose/stachyose/melibiose transport system permease protein